jgi:hypothetical protein
MADAFSLSQVLPPAAWVGGLGVLLGAVAMLIYWRISPQKKLIALKEEIKGSRHALRAYTGTDGREVLRLAGRAISPALRQMLLILGPTLLAAAPVVLAMLVLGSSHVPFMIGVAVATLVMKFAFKIQ